MSETSTRRFEIVDFAEVPGVPCPCGTSRRALGDVAEFPGTLHVVDISLDARLHYHKRLTETYFILECEPDAKLQLDDELIDLKPHMCVVIHPGVRHRAVGKMKVLNIVVPEFDPADEWTSSPPVVVNGRESPGNAGNGAVAEEVGSIDWPMWRGPEQNGISRQTGLIDSWDPDGENVLWKNDNLGTRSTPIIMNGKLYQLMRDAVDTPREGEKVVCVDADTGEILWENKFNVYLSDVPAERVGWSCCVGDPETGNVYALGVCGYFQCIDGETGETIWSHSMSEEYGLLSTYGGRTNVPVIFEDLVIISAVVIGWGDMAKPAHQFLAFDKNTGEVVWFEGTTPLPDDTTYSTPTVTVVDGRAMMIFEAGDGKVWAMEPRTGRPIWQYDLAMRGLNTSPLVVGDKVYAGNGEENMDGRTMGAMVGLDATQTGDINETGELWLTRELRIGKSSPLMVDNRLYVVDDSAGLYVLDPETGEQVAKRTKLGTMMRSSLLYADGKIYACTANGRCYILKPDERKGVDIIHRLRLPAGNEVHGSPIVYRGRIYLPTTDTLYCLADPEAEVGVDPAPTVQEEAPVQEHPDPAYVQVVPAESLIKPGDELKFRARLFNSYGQLLEDDVEATFTADNGGKFEGNTFIAAGSSEGTPKHSGVIVTAKVGDLTGDARIRVVPELPWHFDFSDGQVPLTWIGARYRHQPREVDGEPLMVKVTTIPKGTRSQSWIGHPELHDYTIEADVMGAITNGRMPDIGLIGQRYTLDLMGDSQQLQIRTWTPQLSRMSETVPLKWEPNVWYHLKFRTAVEDGVAVLRGKVWPRDEAEPEEWTVVARDEAPNTNGSPGLFGNAKDAEIFYDNISVTPN
ncbi:unnamed protein product [Cladocopium goreaui]|uniref:Serine/threonine-protein kinase AfsK n=1 Tax=Cladocopium goreaui TaxID=2562237 RepID=A0A9P1BF38_9DINO|nr:unnamed protein product [Cladocopium goreaui]